jgi:hypothetical protein
MGSPWGPGRGSPPLVSRSGVLPSAPGDVPDAGCGVGLAGASVCVGAVVVRACTGCALAQDAEPAVFSDATALVADAMDQLNVVAMHWAAAECDRDYRRGSVAQSR